MPRSSKQFPRRLVGLKIPAGEHLSRRRLAKAFGAKARPGLIAASPRGDFENDFRHLKDWRSLRRILHKGKRTKGFQG
jgi:hypothetical protein